MSQLLGGCGRKGSLFRDQGGEGAVTQRKMCSRVAWPVTSRGPHWHSAPRVRGHQLKGLPLHLPPWTPCLHQPPAGPRARARPLKEGGQPLCRTSPGRSGSCRAAGAAALRGWAGVGSALSLRSPSTPHWSWAPSLNQTHSVPTRGPRLSWL